MKNTLSLCAVAVVALMAMAGCEKEGVPGDDSFSSEKLVGEWDLTYGSTYSVGADWTAGVEYYPGESRYDVLSFWSSSSYEPVEYYEGHDSSLERHDLQEGENYEDVAKKYRSTHLKFDGQKVDVKYTWPVGVCDSDYKVNFFVLHSREVTFDYTYDGTTLAVGGMYYTFNYLSTKGILYFAGPEQYSPSINNLKLHQNFAMKSCSPKIKGGKGNLNEDDYNLLWTSSTYYPGGLFGHLVIGRYTVKEGHSYMFQVQPGADSEYQWEDFPDLQIRASSSDPESVSVSVPDSHSGTQKDVKVKGLKAGASADVKIELVTSGKKSTPVYRNTIKVTVEY